MNILKWTITIAYVNILCMAAWRDWKNQRIEDKVHLKLVGLAVCEMCLGQGLPWQERIIGCIAVAVPMLLITICLGRGFGGGDIKLMASAGFFIGGKEIVSAAVYGILLSGIYCIGMLLKRKIKRKDTFPLGPFLAAGLIIEKICTIYA